MAESADLRGINTIMMDLIDDQGFVRDLMAFVYENAMRFAREQIRAGADVIGVGDAASSLVGPELFRDVVHEWEKKFVDAIHGMGGLVRLHICGNTNAIFHFLADVKADILDLDSMALVADAREKIGKDRLLSGNIDPVRVLQDGTPAEVTEAFTRCFADAGGARYAVNAGCEIPRRTPPENLRAMKEFARRHRE
jgi:uroporphyrinogen-III decarboxylase